MVRTECQWRNLPNDFPKWENVYYYFRKWSKDDSWQAINEVLRKLEREKRGRKPEPTGAIVDSQSVKTGITPNGVRGFDGGKLIIGRKRHILVDTCDLLLAVVVTAASVQDRDGVRLMVTNRLILG